VRFERLIDGIELYEKVRLLRKKCSSEALEALDQQLEVLRVQNVNDPSYNWAEYLQNLNKVVNKTARESVVCD
jgi:hypothetical protein